MKFAHYNKTNADGTKVEGLCHRSKLEYLAEEGATFNVAMISDEDAAELTAQWGGVEIAPPAAEQKAIAKQRADAKKKAEDDAKALADAEKAEAAKAAKKVA